MNGIDIEGRSLLMISEVHACAAELAELRQRVEDDWAALVAMTKQRDQAARLLGETEAALAQTLEAVDAMAQGQTDLINLLMACLAQGEALPQSLREEIGDLMKGAVVVEQLPGGALTTRTLTPEEEKGPFG